MSLKCRNYCFTTFQPSVIDEHEFIKCIVYQREVCPETKREHIQGYVELLKPMRMTAVKVMFNDSTMHLEKRRGTRSEAIDYCKKEDTRLPGTEPVVKGDIKKGQGYRSDLDAIAANISNGMTLDQVIEEHPAQYLRYHRGFEKLRAAYIRRVSQQFRKIDVKVFYGDTGTGKTRTAMESDTGDNVFKLNNMGHNTWFDGYDGQDTLVLDEFYGWIMPATLLSLLDGYHTRLPIKGGFTYANWTKVIITSNTHPDMWYTKITQSVHAALRRRITEIREFRSES